MRKATWILWFVLPGLIGCQGNWAGPDRVRIWAVPQGVTVFSDVSIDPENEVFSAAEERIRLEAAVNETVAFQLVFRSDNENNIDQVVLDDLRQGDRAIPADQISLFREIRVPVTDYPAWYLRLTPYLRSLRLFPDVLVPLSAPSGALPIALQPGACEAVWVEIHVPPGTAEGKYRSTIKVSTRRGRKRSLDLMLEVWPFALTTTRHLPILAGVETTQLLKHHLVVNGLPYAPSRLSFDDPAYRRAAAVLDACLRLLHDHRCEPMPRDIQPIRNVGLGGQMELGWSDYDRLIAGVVDGSAFADRVAAAAWPIPIDEKSPSPETYGGWGSRTYEQFLVDYLRQCVSHFVDRDWWHRHFVWISPGGASQPQRYQGFMQLGRLIRAAEPTLRTVCPLPPGSMAAYGWHGDGWIDVADLANIWAPPASLMVPADLARQQDTGTEIWLNPDRPPYAGSLSMLAPSVHVRSLAWQAYRYGCNGILLGAINDWPEDGLPVATGSEACLIWPGKAYGLDAPVPSIRLKRLLRSTQDYEYLWLLERHRRPALARMIAEDLFSFGGADCYGDHLLDSRPNGWVADPAAWSLARKLIARELMLAIAEQDQTSKRTDSESTERFERQLEWARLTSAVRKVHLQLEGVRVLPRRQTADSPQVIEVTASVFNGTRKPLTGQITLADAMQGWEASEPAEWINGLEPRGRTRRLVRIQTDTLQPNVDGVVPVGLTLKGGPNEFASRTHRLCMLTSRELTRPLTIDGQLDDWPLGSGNVAGDFVLVGAADVQKIGSFSSDRPSQQTLVFVAHNQDALYVAFNCEDDLLADRRLSRGNVVHYDGLWPVGDDLVEVVLDPTGQAVHAGDLLHIVVKANGAVISERGVTCLEQVTGYSPWPANIRAAVHEQNQAGRWTVEIRIPLAALGECSDIIGINFVRFQPRLGEYASWSGARRHLYSPVTLGNLRLPH